MKKILIFFAIATLLIGCKKDILELTPVDRVSESTVWKDQNFVQAYVNAQYMVMQTHFNNYLHQYADESYSKYDPDIAWSFRQNSLAPDNVSGLSPQLNFWTLGYKYLYNINVFFEKIDATGFDESIIKSMKGEMSFLRAYIYSTLLTSYGGVPIIEKVYKLDETLTGITRNSYEEVLNYILNDLNYVIANMPAKQSGSNFGRASGDVAQALKSRMLLYDASPLYNPTNDLTKWQAASDAAKDLITSGRYSLFTGNYSALFYTNANSEVIWQRYYSTEDPSGYPHDNIAPQLGGYGNSQPTQNLADAYEMTNGEMPYLQEGSLNPTVNPASGFKADSFWVNRDPRFYTMFAYNGSVFAGETIYTYVGAVTQDEAVTGYYGQKYLNPADPVSSSYAYTNPYIMYRLTEIYLNYAEAEYELGYESIAREYVNKVRQRVSMPDVPATVTGTALRDRIRHERQVELPYEGHRYYDIRRWKIAQEVSLKPIIGMTINKTGNTYTYTRVQLLPGYWDDKQYLTPIPFTDIQKSNLSLVQNPGW
jgi:hypothetical protein